jgi:SapC
MSRLVPVTREGYSQKRWRRNESYAFAASESVVPLVGSEFSKAAVSMPIAFIERSARFVPVAVLSLSPGWNLFVGPAGQWLGRYIPASLRAYPFRFARVEGEKDPVLCIDEDSGLIVDADDQTEQFFAPDGGPSAAVQQVWRFLMELEASRTRTELAISALASAGVIQPWRLNVNIAGQDKAVTGLYRVDEATLNALDDESFLKLRKSSALPLAYLQLLSMGQVAAFEALDRLQQQLASPPRPETAFSLDEFFEKSGSETLKFD